MIYKLLVAFLLGMVVGMFFWEKVGVGDQYKAYIRRIKNKGKDTDQTVVFKPVLDGKDKSNSKLSLRERRAKNKARRQARKADSKG